MFSSKGLGKNYNKNVLPPVPYPCMFTLRLRQLRLIIGNKKNAGKSFRDEKQRESSVCGTRAGVQSTFSATINERSHAKPLFSLGLQSDKPTLGWLLT